MPRLDVQIHRGTTRTVLLAGRWAIKVPRLTLSGRPLSWTVAHGVLANLSERDLTAAGATGIAPVLWSLAGLVQVYPRCAPAPYEPRDYTAIADPAVPVDPRPHNVGLLAGELVWLDYAESGECVACGRYRHERGRR